MAPAAPTAAPRPMPGRRVGAIRAVGAGRRFVLVEIGASGGSSQAVDDGQELLCVHPDGRGAEGLAASVRVSRERRPPFVVADVLSGEPLAGDEVYLVRGGGSPAPTPVPTPPATSFLMPSSLFPTATPAPQ